MILRFIDTNNVSNIIHYSTTLQTHKEYNLFYGKQFISNNAMVDNFESPQALAQVADFHRTFQHPILNSPQIPSLDRANLRVALLSEELKELADAIAQKDIVEVADALCDLQYVLAGAVLEFGLGAKFKELFDEVQRSNMSKACNTEEEAKQTMEFYQQKGQESNYKKDGDKFLVFRKQDGKTLKSINYSPADLKSILK